MASMCEPSHAQPSFLTAPASRVSDVHHEPQRLAVGSLPVGKERLALRFGGHVWTTRPESGLEKLARDLAPRLSPPPCFARDAPFQRNRDPDRQNR
jgi:hypothetical protein